jgi:nucleotide-binding universal stress UspA family protein
MTEFRRILCAVDFSQPSERAFEYALALAARLGAEVNVVHVYQVPAYALADGVFEMPSEVVGELVSWIKEQLDQFVAAKARPGVNSTARLCEGIPYVEIVRAAKDADMIVVGTHGRTGLNHLLVGSVAERVVRTSDIPVVTVRTH